MVSGCKICAGLGPMIGSNFGAFIWASFWGLGSRDCLQDKQISGDPFWGSFLGPFSGSLLVLFLESFFGALLWASSWSALQVLGFWQRYLFGVPVIRTIVFWGLCWGPLILGNYHIPLILFLCPNHLIKECTFNHLRNLGII